MITVIIPAFNEETRIKATVEAVYSEMKNQNEPFEILVVNDGSRDNTKQVVKTLENGHIRLLSYDENKGKGAAVKYGVKYAAGQSIIFMDADLPYSPKNIALAAKMLCEGYDVVMGQRVENGGAKYPFHRKLMSFGFNRFIKMALGITEKDTQCGFKGFRYGAAQKIFDKMTLSGWGFDVEMLFLAKKMGYTIGRLPVTLHHDEAGSKVHPVKASKAMMSEVMQVRKNNQNKMYE